MSIINGYKYRVIKSYLLILLVCITGCADSGVNIGNHEVNYLDSNLYFGNYTVSYNDYGFYVLDNGELVYYQKDSNKPISLANLSFVDDKPIDNSVNEYTVTQYTDIVEGNSNGIIQYGDFLYFISRVETIEGVLTYSIFRTDVRGESRETVLELQSPGNFIIQDGKIIVASMSTYQQSEITIYDIANKTTKTHSYDFYISSILPAESVVFFDFYSTEGIYYVAKLDIESGNYEILFEGSTLCSSEQYVAYFTMNYYLDENIPEGSERIQTTYLYDYINDRIVLELQNEIINGISDSFIYTSQQNGIQTYRIRDFDGNILDEVTPSDSLQLDYEPYFSDFGPLDIDYILRAFDDTVIGITNENYTSQRLFSCSFTEQKCEYLD